MGVSPRPLKGNSESDGGCQLKNSDNRRQWSRQIKVRNRERGRCRGTFIPSLLLRFVNNTFDPDQASTIGWSLCVSDLAQSITSL